MAQYTKVSFDTYIKETYLRKAVLMKNLVPENINPVKPLGDFLKDKKKQKHINFDKILKKIQGGN